ELLVSVMGMGADRAVDVAETLGDRQHVGVAPDPGGDGDDARQPGRLGAADDGIELAREVGKIEMAVAVDQGRFRQVARLGGAVWRHVGSDAGAQGAPAYSPRGSTARPATRFDLQTAGGKTSLEGERAYAYGRVDHFSVAGRSRSPYRRRPSKQVHGV